jgi:hypothetical protein
MMRQGSFPGAGFASAGTSGWDAVAMPGRYRASPGATHLPTAVHTTWRAAAPGGAIPRMEIGKPVRKIVVEPIRDPVPERTPKPAPEPAPSRPEPVRVKA